jgi:putative transposase
VNQRDKKAVAAKLKQIWQQPDRKSAIRMARIFIGEFQNKYPLAVETLREGLEDSLQFYALQELCLCRSGSAVAPYRWRLT